LAGRLVDPVTRYAEALVEGRVPASAIHRAAGARHLTDLERAKARGLKWNVRKARWLIEFFSHLTHYKGEWARQPIVLEPWQAFIVGSIWGWRTKDGLRRFRLSYCELPRKQGKSTIAAGLGLALAFFDEEPGAEVYAAATKRDQARIVFAAARQMVIQSRALRRRVDVQSNNLNDPLSVSKFEPISADASTLDGLNASGVIIDELHRHRTSAIVDVVSTAVGARRNPHQFEITTAGFDRESVCYRHHEHSRNVLNGALEDDAWFAFIATIDEGDDWTSVDAWRKANPNFGVSVKESYLARKCREAQDILIHQNSFRQLHLNEWTQQSTRAIDLAVWDQARDAVDARALEGRPCYAGLDLATTTDLTACVLVFPDADGGMTLLPRFWLPDFKLAQRVARDRVPYDRWSQEGLVTLTPGRTVDYDIVRRDVRELGTRYRLLEIGYDPWNASQIAKQLGEGDGFPMVEIRQGFRSLNEPTKRLLALLLDAKLRHGGDPVLRWMANNLSVAMDAAGNLKPDREKSGGRIDGIVAAIMGLGRALVASQESPAVSVYETRDLEVIDPFGEGAGGTTYGGFSRDPFV
jgi:phage terminase large subunit-like protein